MCVWEGVVCVGGYSVCVGGCSVCVWKVWCVYEHVRVHGVCVCVCDVFARESTSVYLPDVNAHDYSSTSYRPFLLHFYILKH